jgi:hypothetical protein
MAILPGAMMPRAGAGWERHTRLCQVGAMSDDPRRIRTSDVVFALVCVIVALIGAFIAENPYLGAQAGTVLAALGLGVRWLLGRRQA